MYRSNSLEKIDFPHSKTYWDEMYHLKNTEYCICGHCAKKYKSGVKNSKAIKNHLISVHNYKIVNLKINNDDINNKLFRFITYCNISSTILDSVAFRQFCASLSYQPPRRENYNTFLDVESRIITV